jgi:hypothetical protein
MMRNSENRYSFTNSEVRSMMDENQINNNNLTQNKNYPKTAV